MNALLGKSVDVQITLPDGRTFDLDDNFCASLEVKSFQGITNIPGVVETNMTFISRSTPMMSLTDSYKGKSESYCAYCYSDWNPDIRGNCASCGAPRKSARAYD